MELFSALKKKSQHLPGAYVFICRGPGYSSFSANITVGGLNGPAMYDTLRKFGYTGSAEKIVFFGPDWNKTSYSSAKLQGDGEADDMIEKIKLAVQSKGYSYQDEEIKTIEFSENSMFHTLGYFVTYYFTKR